MNRETQRRLVPAAVAVLLGVFITLLGFVLEERQMSLVVRTRSVKPVLDPLRNLFIAVCLPVLEVANRLGDFGFGAFLALSLFNVLLWSSVLYLVGRRIRSSFTDARSA